MGWWSSATQQQQAFTVNTTATLPYCPPAQTKGKRKEKKEKKYLERLFYSVF